MKTLWLTNPGHQWEGINPDGLWDDESSTTHTLRNSEATFTFQQTHAGLSLMSWSRDGGTSWVNNDRALWRATVFDATLGKELGVRLVGPDAATMEWVEPTADGLAASWLVNLSGDSLRVRLDFTLEGDSLFLESKASWVGTPTRWAVDCVALLPLMMDYKDVGDDFAVQAAIKGVQVKDPRYRFRYIPQDEDQPVFGWLERTRNLTVTTSGKSQSMPIWGYYSSSSKEGWMIWADDRADEVMTGFFQSAGLYLQWEYWIPQPGWVQAGNNGHALETSTKIALRPFLATTTQAWFDMADHYRQRLEINRPSWYVPKIALDPDRSELERRPFVWCDWDLDNFDNENDGAQAANEISGAVDKLRSELGVGTEVPVLGWIVHNAARTRPHMPFLGTGHDTTRDGVDAAHGTVVKGLKNAFLGLHKPANHAPGATDGANWRDGTDDFWDEWEGKEMYVRQRLASIQGLSDSNRGNNGSLPDDFYLEFNTTIVSWDPDFDPSKYAGRLAVADALPLFKKFFSWGGLGIRVEDPVHGVLQGEVARIQVSGGTNADIRLPGLRDRNGYIKSPTVGGSVFLADQEDDFCHHAILGSEAAAFLQENLVREQRDSWRQGLLYFDVYPARSLRNKTLCSGDHSSWSRIIPGYVNHPQGGGSWWTKSVRDYYRLYWEAARREQSPGFVWMGSEYLDEVHFPYNCMGLHQAGYSKLWRIYSPAPNAASGDFSSQADHGIHPVPMFHVVHSGRGFCIQRGFGFGNGALSTLTRNDLTFSDAAPRYRAAFAFWMAGEWVWGMTPPQYLHTGNDNLFTSSAGTDRVDLQGADLWDDDQYTGSEAADATIADTRDLWVSLVKAELNWATSYLRNGQLLTVGDDEGSTKFSVYDYEVFHEPFPGIPLSRRNDLACVWPLTAYPRAVHAAWRAVSGNSVCVFFLNWTDTSGTADWSFPFERFGLSGEVSVFLVAASGALSRQGSFWTTYRYTKTVGSHSMQALLLAPEEEGSAYFSILSDVTDQPQQRFDPVDYYRPVATFEIQLTDSGVPIDVSSATALTFTALLPSGVELTVASAPGGDIKLVTDGTDGRFRIDLSGALFRNNVGVWRVWGQALIDGQEKVGSMAEFVSADS